MRNKHNKTAQVLERIWRVERRCNEMLMELRALRASVARQAEIDEVIDNLRESARVMLEQSRREHRHYKRVAGL